MKWVYCVIMIAGLAFESCRNSADTGNSALPEARGPSQAAADSLGISSTGSAPGMTGSTGATGNPTKADTLTKIANPMVDTFPKKNP
jgi:hypothetical protein